MGYARSNWKISTREIPADVLQASHLGSGVLFTGVASQIVKFRITIQHDSLAGNVVTFSMEGWGSPAWVQPEFATGSPPLTWCGLRTSVTANASLVYMTYAGATGSMGSLAATVSVPYNILALIASR